MARRLLTWWWVVSISGCWAEEPLIHDAFTPQQWAHLRDTYKPPSPNAACPNLAAGVNCGSASRLGQQLFFEPRLSGGKNGYPAGTTSCATCHDAVSGKSAGWFIDIRPGSAVSVGAKGPTEPTGHNTLSVVNMYIGDRESYTWSGQCTNQPCQTPTNVVRDIAFPKAMASSADIVARVIRSEPVYLSAYRLAFGTDPLNETDPKVQTNVELALDLYMRKLVSLDSPFDRFITGDDAAITASAKRGFALFVGKAMCSECHAGGMFTDYGAHVTGVEDPKLDKGFQETGAFYTPSLRHVAETGPYMHNGSQATLADVIEFYRWGGSAATYFGDKDALMHPFELDNDEAKDLEAFMRSLTGAPLTTEVRADTHVPSMTMPMSCTPPMSPPNSGLVCNGACRDIMNDPQNCGGCNKICSSYCMGGMCGP